MPKQPTARSFTVALPARRDIADILRYSRKEFGAAAALRYGDLIKQSLRDIEADPTRPGVSQRASLPADLHLFHIASSRGRAGGDPVKTPRHFVMFRLTAERVEVLRLLHDNRDLARHVPPDDPAE